tara:strand:+ start:87 stop:521 length:435 start_codon:yes stop_codon:yes gene_type:complete
MIEYYKCQSKAIFVEVPASTAAVTTENVELAPFGTRACLRAFSGFSAPAAYDNSSLSGETNSTLVSVEFHMKDVPETTVLEILLPLHPGHAAYHTGGSGGSGMSFHIPGPGILFDQGLGVKMTVPANSSVNGPIMGLLNVVYSV